MADETISCRDCGKTFLFKQSESEFYQSKGFSKPSRCRDCRNKKNGGAGNANRNTSSGQTESRRQPMKNVWCADGSILGHLVEVPESLVIDPNRPWQCKEHRGQRQPRKMKDVWCAAGGHTVSVPETLKIDESRDFRCKDCKEKGIQFPHRPAQTKPVYCNACHIAFDLPVSFIAGPNWRCQECRRTGLHSTQMGPRPMQPDNNYLRGMNGRDMLQPRRPQGPKPFRGGFGGKKW